MTGKRQRRGRRGGSNQNNAKTMSLPKDPIAKIREEQRQEGLRRMKLEAQTGNI